MGLPPAPAAALTAAGASINRAIALFIVIALIALLVVIVFSMRTWRMPGLRSARSRRIKEAAAADVAAIEEDDALVSPDAPGREEDDL